jgi:uncharacterized protein
MTAPSVEAETLSAANHLSAFNWSVSNEALEARIDALHWSEIERQLDAQGYAVIDKLLSGAASRELAAQYAADELFRSRVVMERHGYGRGEYKYFRYPLPSPVAVLRGALYARLYGIANRWLSAMSSTLKDSSSAKNGSSAKNSGIEYPPSHEEFLQRCWQAGQTRPTPLLLQYGTGDYNCLHQDLYGEQVFPLQVAVLLNQPSVDFDGGEFVLTERRPRQQTRPRVVPLTQGDAVIFAVRQRPVQGARGSYRVEMRHGVSELRSGHRHTLGIIFHDAA